MAVILHHFTEFDTFWGKLHHSGWSYTHTVYDTNVAQKNLGQYMIYSGGPIIFNTLVRTKLLNSGPRTWPQETRNIALYCMMQKVFRELERFRRGLRMWRTDRQTEPLLAITRSNDLR